MARCTTLAGVVAWFALSLLAPPTALGQGSSWSYEGSTGPRFWPSLFPHFCAGNFQSPINLQTGDMVPSTLGRIHFSRRYSQNLEDVPFENNGHTARLDLSRFSKDLTIYGTDLPGKFKLIEAHFHWGNPKSESVGSEHTIEGRAFPMEMHLVHINVKYRTLNEARNQPDGIAVLSVLFRIKSTQNAHIENITESLFAIQESGTTTLVPQVDIDRIMPTDKLRFYRYIGSLTTPACNEGVIWTVFSRTVPIGENQIKNFYLLRAESGNLLRNNFRPTQPLNGRTVLANGKEPTVSELIERSH